MWRMFKSRKLLRLPIFNRQKFKAHYSPQVEDGRKGFLLIDPFFDFEEVENNLSLIQASASARRIRFEPHIFIRLYERYKMLNKQIQKMKMRKEEINRLATAQALLNKEKPTGTLHTSDTLKEIRQTSRELRNELKQITMDFNFVSEELNALVFNIPNNIHPLSKSATNVVRETQDCSKHDNRNVNMTDILIQSENKVNLPPNQINSDWCLLLNAIGLWISSVLRKNNLSQVSPPAMVKSYIVESCGQNTEVQVKGLENSMLNLCGATSMPFAAYYMMTITDLCSLPKSLYTLGSRYHLDPVGRFSLPNFYTKSPQTKSVELFGLTKDSVEESDRLCMLYLDIMTNLYTSLDLKWRVVENSYEHFSPAMYRKMSIEIWFPISQCYLEVGNVYSCTDYISRRLRIQYLVNPIRSEASETRNKNLRFVHTVHATCAYIEVIMAALIEYYQKEDYSVSVPSILKSYINGIDKLQ